MEAGLVAEVGEAGSLSIQIYQAKPNRVFAIITYMRFLRWSLATLFIILVPIWLFLLVPKFNNFGPKSLQSSLKNHNVYEQLSTYLHQSPSSVAPTSSQDQLANHAVVVLRSFMTPEYVEEKSNQLIYDTTTWLTVENASPPELSLNDIRQQVTTQYPAAEAQIKQLQNQLAEYRDIQTQNGLPPVDGIEGINADGSASVEEIAKLLQQSESLDSFIAGDFTIQTESILEPVKQTYNFYSVSIIVFGILLLILLIGIALASQKWSQRMSWIGWTLMIAGAINAILAVLFSTLILRIGLNTLIDAIPGQAEVVGSLSRATLQSLLANYLPLQLQWSAALLVIGILIVISSRILHRRGQRLTSTKVDQAPTNTTLAETPSTNQDADTKTTSSQIKPSNTNQKTS